MPKHKVTAGQLLATVSVIGLSVGMAPALAADNGNQGVLIGMSQQDKHNTQIKGESKYLKLDSTMVKGESSDQVKGNSSQVKLHSTHIKLDSTMMKGESSDQVKGHSSQIKLHSNQIKMQGTTELNPQPEPPGSTAGNSMQIKLHNSNQIKQHGGSSDASAGGGQSSDIVSPRDAASGLPTGK
jgi:hypothetical protein